MALNYTVYQYDGSRNAVVMTDMVGKQLVINCDKAEEQVVFDELEDVLVDLGKNKTLTCGLALQQGLEHIAGFEASTMKFRSNTMELYFETEHFDAFMQLLDSYPRVERLHEPKTFPWLQRGIHIFDPDGHLIEVSESMYSVACKQFKEGKTIEETAKLVQHPLEVVRGWYEQYQKELISVCGTDCSVCYCFGKMCNGCNSCEGKVFHITRNYPIMF